MRVSFVRAIAVGLFVAMATSLGFAFALPRAEAEPKRADLSSIAPVSFNVAEEVTVEMSVTGFEPAVIEIKTGTTVTWHNTEPADYPVVSGYHSVVADDGSFDSKKVAPGARWSFTFDEPGTFDYHCSIHPHMTGRVVVTGEPVKEEPKTERIEIVEPDPNDQNTWGYKPAKLDVEVGTTVTWVNNGAQDHTATDDDGAFDSGTLKPGEKFTFTFKKVGVYNYKCTPHPWMKATITVSEPGKGPPREEPEDDESGSDSSSTAPPASKSGGGGGPTTHYVNIVEGGSTDDWGYDPSGLSVATGDTVVWENTGSTDHTVTASDGSFDSGNIPPGGTWEYTFDEEGEFEYTCTPHPFMVASVSVSDSPTTTGATGSTAPKSVSSTDDMSDMDMSGATTTSTGAPVAVAEEPAELQAASFTTLSGKEASLALIAGTFAAAVAFLVGQWWGFRIKSTQRSTGAVS